MQRLRDHPVATTAAAFAIAAGTVAAIAGAWGWRAFGDAWSRPRWAWIALVCGAAFLSLPCYVSAYRATARAGHGPRLSSRLAAAFVVAGFGAFAPGGGFLIDRRALHAIEDDPERATVRVLGLGALEWAVLAPAAWLSAVVLLASGDAKPMPSLLWPWAVAVPIGFAIGLPLSRPRRGRPVMLRGVGVLHELAARPARYAGAWLGAAAYWACDIASLYAAMRFIGLRPNLGEIVLAFATGYALTRRSLPLGGAGVTEALMTFALHWVGQPIPAALAAVAVYRVFNFLLPTVPALLVLPRVRPLLDAADEDRTPAGPELPLPRRPLPADGGLT